MFSKEKPACALTPAAPQTPTALALQCLTLLATIVVVLSEAKRSVALQKNAEQLFVETETALQVKTTPIALLTVVLAETEFATRAKTILIALKTALFAMETAFASLGRTTLLAKTANAEMERATPARRALPATKTAIVMETQTVLRMASHAITEWLTGLTTVASTTSARRPLQQCGRTEGKGT